MIKCIFIFALTSLFFTSLSYSQDWYKDPFRFLLPQAVREEEEGVERIIEETEKSLPAMVFQGVLWDSDLSQVIIDGEVYKVGDNLKDLDARILKIEKGTVFILYGETVYKIEIGKKGEL